MSEIKRRKITKKDWSKVQDQFLNEYEQRKNDKFRKLHETIWREVDRQIIMEPLKRKNKDGSQVDEEWRSVMELGELAKASEIITADVMRLTFPSTRSWFETHSEVTGQLDPATGAKVVNQEEQDFNDKALRALMVQQHEDFGTKARYELSVKEALHHGSYVSEIRFEYRNKYYNAQGGISTMGAPVWVPYSMWNAYPDPNPSVIGTDLFYTGSIILRDYMPLYILKEVAKGNGWMTENIEKIPRRKNENKDVETDDIELVKRSGDFVIQRGDGDILLPNYKCILANGVIVYADSNDLPYPPVIFSGYERMDVRDPYYTSPLIKLSPMQKLASQLANKYLDCVWLRVEPPGIYDANDPQFVLNGGPRIAPGAQTGSKSSAAWQELKIGDPESALRGLELIIAQMNQGLGINAIRAGAGGDVTDKTATEIQTVEAKAEIRTAEFVDKQERHALRPFLYMQHELNKLYMQTYEFYNPEMDAPDFMRATKDQLPAICQFEVVGSRGVLGEKNRMEKKSEVTAWADSSPGFSRLLNRPELLKDAYQDAGEKQPERLILTEEQEDPALLKQQYQEQMQAHEEEIAKLREQLTQAQSKYEIEAAKADHKMEVEEFKAQRAAELAEFKAETERAIALHTAGMKTDLEELKTAHKCSMDEMKTMHETKEQPSVNVMDSSMKGPMEQIGKAILEIGKGLTKNTELLGNIVSRFDSPKEITLKKDKSGSPIGATITVNRIQ